MNNWTIAKTNRIAKGIRVINSILNLVGFELTLNLQGDFSISRL